MSRECVSPSMRPSQLANSAAIVRLPQLLFNRIISERSADQFGKLYKIVHSSKFVQQELQHKRITTLGTSCSLLRQLFSG